MDEQDLERLRNQIKYNEYATDNERELMGCLPYILWFLTTIILIYFLVKK
jgi:hypothetical protein